MQAYFAIVNEGEASGGKLVRQGGVRIAGFVTGLENERAFVASLTVDGSFVGEKRGSVEKLGLLSATADITGGWGDDERQQQCGKQQLFPLSSQGSFHGSTSRSMMSPSCKESMGMAVICFSQVAAP